MVPNGRPNTHEHPHAPAATYLLSRGRALKTRGRWGNVLENAVLNVETYHRQFCPLYEYGGMVQDNE